MNEKRSEPRRRALLSGKILLSSGGVIGCLLRAHSRSGARLKVESVIGIPDTFTLEIVPRRECCTALVAWRKHHEIGVQFVEAT